MKTAILYTTTYGTTQRCAEALVAAIGQGSQSFDLKRYPEPNLQEFDAVIVGASVYVGKIQAAAEAYMKSHEEELLKKTASALSMRHARERNEQSTSE